MAIHNSVIVDQGQPAGVIYAATGAIRGNAITTMYFCNRDSSSRTFNLYVVPAGFEANSNNIVYYNKSITSGDTYIVDWEKLVLETGATIRANAGAGNAIVATMSSIGVS